MEGVEESEPTLGSCVGQDLQAMLGREQTVGGAVSGNGRVDVLPFLWPSRISPKVFQPFPTTAADLWPYLVLSRKPF